LIRCAAAIANRTVTNLRVVAFRTPHNSGSRRFYSIVSSARASSVGGMVRPSALPSFGLSQIAIQLVRRKPIHYMEWLSLFLVVAAGTATILTDDKRFALIKPSIFYVITGIGMLKAGWMIRYLPAIVRAVAFHVRDRGLCPGRSDVRVCRADAFMALAWIVPTWTVVMPVFGIVSKVVFLSGSPAIRLTTIRRIRAMPAVEREARPSL
jgi:intracellular septation protein